MDLFNLREEFLKKTLDEKDIHKNPVNQFEAWFLEALNASVKEPNAMTLSTSWADGRISSRVVLLKQVTQEGLVFFTNYNSNKAMQLMQNPYCAVNFMWHELERQVRIEGLAEYVSPQDSDLYFEHRPVNSKLGAWASPQSGVIPNRQYLVDLMEKYGKRYKNKHIERPPNWGGYIVKPSLFEFWQGRENRLHDRIRYKREKNKWIIERLAP